MAEKIVNDLTKGLIRKVNPLKKEQNFYNFALNLSTDKNKIDRLTKVCENALEDYYSLKNIDYVILNVLYLNLDEYIFFITDKINSFSEILHYNKGNLVTKYNNSNLNFKASNVISSTYRINYNGDRLIYFVDGLNKDRVFNLDNIELTDNIESLSINPIYDYSNYIDYSINYTGGSLKSGKYYIFVQPKDINGKTAQFKNIIDGLPIENGNYKEEFTKTSISNITELITFENEAVDFFDVKGLKADTTTSKSITIDLTNLNNNFTTADLYIIIKTETSTEAYIKENIIVGNKYTVTNLSEFITLGSDISSILVDNVIYNKSETLTQKNNRLLLANSTLEAYDYNFQSIANNIKVKPLTKQELFNTNVHLQNVYRVFDDSSSQFRANGDSSRSNSLGNERNAFPTPYYLAKTQKTSLVAKTFMRDEVYALGVYFELENGVYTDVYHIPGRKPNDPTILTPFIGNSSENGRLLQASNISNWDTNPTTIDGETKPAWQIVNTGLTGLLGYYRCETTYPDGYGFPTDGEQDINGKSFIRHHRIPSEYVYPILNSTLINQSNYSITKNIINLEFYDINIPTELITVIKKVHFCIADRTENNKKVLSKGVVYSSREISPGVVRNSEILNAPNSYNNTNKKTDIFEFKSPEVDFKFKNSNIKGSFIKSTAVLTAGVNHMSKVPTRTDALASGGLFPVPGSTINYEGINRSTTEYSNVIYDYKQEFTVTRAFYKNISNFIATMGLKQKKIEDINFIDNNSVIPFAGVTLNNEGNQNTAYFKLKNGENAGVNDLFITNDLYPYVFQDYKNFKSQSSNLFRNFFFQNQENYKNKYSWQEKNVTQEIYFDSTHMTSVLSDNLNIFSEILNLTYSKIVDNNNVVMGDSFIDMHFSKKSYSTLVTNRSYNTIESDFNAKDKFRIAIDISGSNTVFTDFVNTDGIDMSVSDSYICFPVETRLNIRMRRDNDQESHYPHNVLSGVYPVNILEKKALTQETYSLDSVYFNDNSIRPLFSNNIKINDLDNLTRKIGNRVIYSELQNNESSVDNFRNFKANNYKDIITTKGNIHKLFVKDNNLFILTRDSLFRINSSNNYLTTREGGSIYVGTGEFLGTEPEELISLELGYAGTISKLSFSESKFGYLYVDSIRNKIILFSNKLEDLNPIGLEEELDIKLFKYFPDLDDGLDKPLLGYGILTGVDPETDRLFVTKLDYIPTQLMISEYEDESITIIDGLFYKNGTILDFKNSLYFENKSFTVTYDAINNIWISYHDYFPNYYIPHPTKLVIKTDSIFTKKYGEDYTSNFIIDVLFNEHQGITKVFDSIQFDIESETVNKEYTQNFFDSIIVYTPNQTTGEVIFNFNYPNNNIARQDKYWNFSKMLDISKDKLNKKIFNDDWDSIKNEYFIDKILNVQDIDINKDWYTKKRFKDKLLNVRLFKNNLENNKFSINFAVLNYRQSYR